MLLPASRPAPNLCAGAACQLGFLQFFNLHRSQAAIAQLVRHPALAGTAAQLLGAKRLRLYQDAVFLKQPGFAETNWCACCAVHAPVPVQRASQARAA